MTYAIEIRDVYRHFHRHEVLRGLTFSVEPGQIYSLLGRNGAGKTTALRILMGFLRPMHGTSRVLGKDSLELSPADRQRIGYVTEGHKMYRDMRVKDVLSFESGTRKNFNTKYAKDAIQRCNLPLDRLVCILSRGQRAQLSLIMAVADGPEVLIFDDPAMGLDVVMRREFLDAMIDFLADRGTTVLFSSHILTDVERIADRVGIMKDGRLIVDSPLEDLKTRIEKRVWIGSNGAAPPSVDGVLRCRTRREGFDLTLLDATPALEMELCQGGAKLLEPAVPTLEDLFLDLTTDTDSGGILSPLTEELS